MVVVVPCCHSYYNYYSNTLYIHTYIYIYERVREETKYKSEMNTATDSLVTPLLTDAYQLTMAYVSHKHNNNEKERVSEKVSR